MTAWRWAALGGTATILIGLGFGQVPGIGACGAGDGPSIWGGFQNITSVADVRAYIRPDCADAFIPALRSSMWLDALAFIPAFTLFLGALVVAARPPRWHLRVTLVLLAAGFIADQLEGYNLLSILNAFPGTEADVRGVIMANAAKNVLLPLATAGVALAVMRLPGWRRWVGLLTLLGALAALTRSVTDFPPGELGMLVSWLMLAALAVYGALAQWRAGRSLGQTQ